MKPLLACILCLWLTSCGPRQLPPARMAADEFFLQIGENRLQNAYENTAFSFQAQSSFKNFEAIARELGLTAGTVSCEWIAEETKGDDVKLTGHVMSASGTTVNVSVTFVQERGAWRVFSLRTPSQSGDKEEDRFSRLGKGTSFNNSVNRDVPGDKILHDLTEGAITLLNSAVKTRNFHDFYNKVSLAWQRELTEKQLQRAFQSFIDSGVALNVRTLTPVFDTPPVINSDGVLVLIGHYDTKPLNTTFNLRFIYEFPQWKLYGIEVQIRN